jgi:hypothetical protein
MRRYLALAAALLLAACSSDNGETDGGGPPPDAGAEAAAPDTGPPGCGSGSYVLPKGLTELKYDVEGAATTDLKSKGLGITVSGTRYELGTTTHTEAVRFDVKHPAKVYGFAVQWAKIAAGTDPKTELKAGLYPDFGNNGFDFWEKDPLWSGTRCVEDVQQGKWLTYVFPKPVQMTQPGIVYVAHRFTKDPDPLLAMDDATVSGGQCDKFYDCNSAVGLPTVDAVPSGSYYNGLTLRLQYNLKVRLYVQYTRQIKTSEQQFHKQTAVKSSRASVSWGDFDNDGWDDLLLGTTLYRNDKGSFSDVTDASGLKAANTRATGGVWGDFDNDGCLDLLMFAERYDKADTLLKGDCKGKFSDVTSKAGLVDNQTEHSCGKPGVNTAHPTAAAAWVDLDADGYLDLYLANFVCWDSSYSTSYKDTVFHNKGDGTFEEWTGKKGFLLTETASRGVAPVDLDADGDVDLFINNYWLHANLLYINGGGTVSENAASANATGNGRFAVRYYYGHTIGAAWGDLDNDGDFDLLAANLAHPRFWHFSDRTQILLNDGKGTFKDISGGHDKPYGNSSGLRYQETYSVPVLADFDNDGTLDLLITATYDGRPTDFYWGQGDGTFKLDVYDTGIATTNGWGAAAADYDHDGDMDLFVTDLYKNDRKASAGGNWLQVRAVGTKANWAALGSTVRVKAGGKVYLRHVQGGTGKGCQDSMYLHFGLGAATSVSEVSVTYPGGKTVKASGPFTSNQRIWVYEDGKVSKGWAPQ